MLHPPIKNEFDLRDKEKLEEFHRQAEQQQIAQLQSKWTEWQTAHPDVEAFVPAVESPFWGDFATQVLPMHLHDLITEIVSDRYPDYHLEQIVKGEIVGHLGYYQSLGNLYSVCIRELSVVINNEHSTQSLLFHSLEYGTCIV